MVVVASDTDGGRQWSSAGLHWLVGSARGHFHKPQLLVPLPPIGEWNWLAEADASVLPSRSGSRFHTAVVVSGREGTLDPTRGPPSHLRPNMGLRWKGRRAFLGRKTGASLCHWWSAILLFGWFLDQITGHLLLICW